jgi:hypothetical protein
MCIKTYVEADAGLAAIRDSFRPLRRPLARGLTCIKVDVAP